MNSFKITNLKTSSVSVMKAETECSALEKYLHMTLSAHNMSKILGDAKNQGLVDINCHCNNEISVPKYDHQYVVELIDEHTVTQEWLDAHRLEFDYDRFYYE